MRKVYRVEQFVSITVDESKFTPEFMADFRRSFYPFATIGDHMAYLAKAYVAGEVGVFTDFIEGYGNLKDFGIELSDESGMEAEEE